MNRSQCKDCNVKERLINILINDQYESLVFKEKSNKIGYIN